MEIIYRADIIPDAAIIAALYDDAGLPRPTTDLARIKKMYDHSSLVVTAWDNHRLAGISRSLADFSWCCYLADLAVGKNYQRLGIGKKLIDLTKEKAGEQSMVLLLSVESAMEYYPKMGMAKVENGFILHRQQ